MRLKTKALGVRVQNMQLAAGEELEIAPLRMMVRPRDRDG